MLPKQSYMSQSTQRRIISDQLLMAMATLWSKSRYKFGEMDTIWVKPVLIKHQRRVVSNTDLRACYFKPVAVVRAGCDPGSLICADAEQAAAVKAPGQVNNGTKVTPKSR